MANQERALSKRVNEIELRCNTLEQSYNQLKTDFDGKSAALQDAKQQLGKRGEQITELEGEVLRLKTVGDGNEVESMRLELSDKTNRIKELEQQSHQQLDQLSNLLPKKEQFDASVRENNELQQKLQLEIAAREELNSAQLRLSELEDERKAWTTYLESQASDNEMLHFDSPEELARAYMTERVEKAALASQLGDMQPELTSKDERIAELEASLALARRELHEPKTRPTSSNGSGIDAKVRARLERQRVLAVKEADYLRAQLKEMTDEEKEQHTEVLPDNQAKHIQHLEEVAGSYRREVEKLNAELASIEKEQNKENTPSTPRTASKRSLDDDASDERLGELLRKNRQLQDSLTKFQTRNSVLENEVSARNQQIVTLKSRSSGTRVLELRDNPTARTEKIKQATLDALQAENTTLKQQLSQNLPTVSTGSSTGQADLVPKATLDLLQLQLEDKDSTIRSREKTIDRLRTIFRSASNEVREAVYSLLGWKVNIQPNGNTRLVSLYYPKNKGHGDGEEGNWIDFHGENRTMKISGGPKSEFANEMRSLLEFWAEEKGQIPCFLAAVTMEFYDKYGSPEERGKAVKE